VRKKPDTMFFGRTSGFVVNYAPDYAVRFDVEGNAVEQFSRAYYPEDVSITIGRKTVPAATVARMIGALPKTPSL
jgi:hypothetical protein